MTEATRLVLASIDAEFADGSRLRHLAVEWSDEAARWEWTYDDGEMLFWGCIREGRVEPVGYESLVTPEYRAPGAEVKPRLIDIFTDAEGTTPPPGHIPTYEGPPPPSDKDGLLERIIYVEYRYDLSEKVVADCAAIAEWARGCEYITKVEDGPGESVPSDARFVLLRLYTTNDMVMDMTRVLIQTWDDTFSERHIDWFMDTDLRYM